MTPMIARATPSIANPHAPYCLPCCTPQGFARSIAAGVSVGKILNAKHRDLQQEVLNEGEADHDQHRHDNRVGHVDKDGLAQRGTTTPRSRRSCCATSAAQDFVTRELGPLLEHGVRDGVLRQHYDTDALDASTLLAAIFGFLPADDERLRRSVEAIADDLTEDGFVLRYRTGETDDDLSARRELPDLLVLPRVGAGDRRRDPARPRPDGEAAERPLSAGALRRGVRQQHRPPPRYLLPGLLPLGADLGGGEDHPRRAAGGALVVDCHDVIVIGQRRRRRHSRPLPRPSGKRVLLLERGDWLPGEPQHWIAQDIDASCIRASAPSTRR